MLDLIKIIISCIVYGIFSLSEKLLRFCKNNPIGSFFIALCIAISQLPTPDETFTYTSQPEINRVSEANISVAEKAYLLTKTTDIIDAADFHGEFDDIWYENPLAETETESNLDTEQEFDIFDSIKESDIPSGYDSESENNFQRKLNNLGVRAGFLPSSKISSTTESLCGLEYAPGLVDDLNSDSKLSQDRRLSVKTEERFNKRRKSNDYIGIAIKDKQPFYNPFSQLRDKYYHSWAFPKSLGPNMSKSKLRKVQNIALDGSKRNYKRRLKVLRDKNFISDQDIVRLNGNLREHILDPKTYIIRGTLGAEREKQNPKLKKIQGYHLYNDIIKVDAFYDLSDRNLRTFMLVKKQEKQNDILLNGNLN